MNEEQLLKDIEADPRKFGEVYEAFHPNIFGYVYRRTMDYDAARDVTAETFLKAYVNISRFQWKNVSILHWLYKIASNELNRYFNGHKYQPQSLCRIQEEYGIDITDGSNAETENIRLQNELEQHQEFLRINQELRRLDVKYQEVIALRYFEHKSVREIAEILSKKEGTVKSLLSRGLDKLKDTLKN